MSKNTVFTYIFCYAALPVLLASCQSSNNNQDYKTYGKAAKELVELVNSNPDLRSMLETSIDKAKQKNPDSTTNPAQSLQQYYDFVSKVETSMPWEIMKTSKETPLFENMFQTLCAFYFVSDQSIPQLENKGYFNNSLQYAQPFASWLTRFNQSWRNYLDSRESWNDSYYQLLLKDSVFGLQKGWYEDPSHWHSFNDFFARRLRSPAERPIASPGDESVVCSFADSRPQGVWAIDSNSNIVSRNGVAVKSATLKSISELLGKDSHYKDSFANGTFTHSFLNIYDYHRYHFPLSGTIKEARIIQGINPTGGILEWDAGQNRYVFTPSSVGWQMLETRGCIVLQTNNYGLVALLPIGMATVGSVNFENNVKAGNRVKKGDMMGYFLFGGSDFIALFQDKVRFILDAPKNENDDSYMHLLMGERLGHLNKK